MACGCDLKQHLLGMSLQQAGMVPSSRNSHWSVVYMALYTDCDSVMAIAELAKQCRADNMLYNTYNPQAICIEQGTTWCVTHQVWHIVWRSSAAC